MYAIHYIGGAMNVKKMPKKQAVEYAQQTKHTQHTTYTYTLDNRGIVTSCHAVVRHIRNGYEQDYTRTVNYTIE